MSLNDIMQSAQGGQAIDNLASRFGISPQQAQSAITALLPAFQMGLQNTAQSGGGLQTILQHLGNGTHQDAYINPTAAQSPGVAQQGGAVLGDIFGGHQVNSQVAQQASTESGVPASVIQAMLPVIASMIIGGLSHAAQNGGGWGGALSSIIGSLEGGAGLGQAGRPGIPSPTTQEPGDGGLGGLVGSVLGGLFGGGQQAAPGRAAPSAPYRPASQGGPDDGGQGGSGGSAESVLNDLSRMFQAGTPASPQHEANLADILGQSGNGR